MSHLLSILVCLAAATVTCFTLPTFFKTESIVTSRSKPYQRDHHILFQTVKANSVSPSLDRFEQFANSTPDAGAPCVLTIEGSRYNLTAWAKSHPGGERILAKFNEKDATKSFRAAHHSMAAYEMLQDFAIDDSLQPPTYSLYSIPRWRAKLFTKEDRIGVHKYLGMFCLLNFIFRFYQMLLGDPSAGLGTRVGKGPSAFPVLFLVPHGMLSVSALIFPHIPRERVVGKPMIWQEYRIHNLIFGVRSVICALFCALSFRYPTNLGVRRLSISGSCLSVLAANIGADLATKKLQPHETGSTTATMPYWEGCSVKTQKKFKQFYAYSQFLATLSCVAVINPAWPLSVLLAIQIASLLMTLVRKGLLSAKGYHMGYTASLIAPYFVGIRSMLYMKNLQFPIMLAFGYVLFQARRRGLNKYLLWVPVIVARIAIGDRLLDWSSWAVH